MRKTQRNKKWKIYKQINAKKLLNPEELDVARVTCWQPNIEKATLTYDN